MFFSKYCYRIVIEFNFESFIRPSFSFLSRKVKSSLSYAIVPAWLPSFMLPCNNSLPDGIIPSKLQALDPHSAKQCPRGVQLTLETYILKLFMAVLDCIRINQNHKVRIYKEYHSRNWDSPNPSLASECAPQPSTGGGGAQSPASEGLGKSQFRRLEKSLALCLVCDQNPYRLRVILSLSCKKDFIA